MENVSAMKVFFLPALNGTTNYRATLFCLTLLCYCVILLVNSVLVMTIIWDKNLHEPMYILLCGLCINGLFGTAGFYPKFLSDLLSPVHLISYNGCLLQAYVVNTFIGTDLSILAVMAYDRYVAICRPLVYHSVMTKQRVSQLVYLSWLSPICLVGMNILLTSSLKLCSSILETPLCGNWAIVKLACRSTNTIPSSALAYFTILFFFFHGFFIFCSYVYLIKTCLRSKENWAKFMQTCVPHFISLMTFIVMILTDLMFRRFGSTDLPQGAKNFISIEFLFIPPILNPLIYGFKLTKIRNRVVDTVRGKRKLFEWTEQSL